MGAIRNMLRDTFDPPPSRPKLEDTGDYGHHRGAMESNTAKMAEYHRKVAAWEKRNGDTQRFSSDRDYDGE